MGDKLSDVFICSVIVYGICWFLWLIIGLKWLIKAWVESNIIFDMIGTSKMLTKAGPSDPLVITDLFLKIYKYQHCLKHFIPTNMIIQTYFVGKRRYRSF